MSSGGAITTFGGRMVRRNKPKQLSREEIAQFMTAAEALHMTIVRPLISTQCDHYRSLQDLHRQLDEWRGRSGEQ